MASEGTWKSLANVARTTDAFLLTVLTKRTYRWDLVRGVEPADVQEPITQDVVHEQRNADRNGTIVKRGRDAWPLKVATDVVITGSACAPRGAPVRQMTVTASIGAHRRSIRVIGARFVERRPTGALSFSAPDPFTKIELSWWNAYGGIDPFVLPKGLDDPPIFAGRPILELFPGAYPRNPCGVGYLVKDTPDVLDGMRLPYLETPNQLLTPETLLVRDPKEWWRRPMPAGFGWFHTLWFPRVLHSGGKPYHLPPASDGHTRLLELEMGVVGGEQLAKPEGRFANVRLTSEAAPGMILPFLKGDESIHLDGFDAEGAMSFALPKERAQVRARADGQELAPLGPFLHTLAIDTDKKQFYVLWSTRFALPVNLSVDIAVDIPLQRVIERCQVTVDGKAFGKDQWPQPRVES